MPTIENETETRFEPLLADPPWPPTARRCAHDVVMPGSMGTGETYALTRPRLYVDVRELDVARRGARLPRWRAQRAAEELARAHNAKRPDGPLWSAWNVYGRWFAATDWEHAVERATR